MIVIRFLLVFVITSTGLISYSQDSTLLKPNGGEDRRVHPFTHIYSADSACQLIVDQEPCFGCCNGNSFFNLQVSCTENESYSPFSDLSISIYSRWGDLIVSSSDPTHLDWTGQTKHDSQVPSGTYYWIVSYKDRSSDSKELLNASGYLTVIR